MAEPKKNKDGFVGGSLVDPKEHAKFLLAQRKKKAQESSKAK